MKNRDKLTRIVDLFFEAGMLRRTPRSGYQFLGTGQENVAEHSFRTAMIGWVMAMNAGADADKTMRMCLFHDLHEARTGDFNYVNKIYNTSEARKSLEHAYAGTGLSEVLLELWDELEACETPEACIAQDADQIDFILNLKEELDLGNKYAGQWLEGAVKRLRTDVGKALAEKALETDHKDWWFLGPDRKWWEKKNGTDKK